MTGGVPPSIDEVRARLRAQGYLDPGLERAIFTAPGASGAIWPSVAMGAVAAALASTAAAWARGSINPGSGAIAVFAALAILDLVPALAVGAAVLLSSRIGRAPARPSASAFGAGVAAALVVFGLFTAGVRSLPPAPGAHPVLALLLVAAAAFYFGRAVRATALSLALRRQILPERRAWRRGSAAAVALVLAAVSATVWRRPPPVPFPSLTVSPRPLPLVVVGLDGVAPDALALLAPDAPRAAWRRDAGNPPEVWTTIATGVPRSRHGVAAYDRIAFLGRIALSPPAGAGWAFRGPLRWAGAAVRLPVSGGERHAYTFWEIAARAGLPTLAVNWWASEKVPGAAIVENREVALAARSGAEDDAAAIARFRELRGIEPKLATIYLPGADIDRGPVTAPARAFVAEEIARARAGREALWIVGDSGRSGTSGSWVWIDPAAATDAGRAFAADAESVAPTAIARLGIPAARDLGSPPATAAFAPAALEASTVATYGDRLSSTPRDAAETGRAYLEKLKSLGYLQ